MLSDQPTLSLYNSLQQNNNNNVVSTMGTIVQQSTSRNNNNNNHNNIRVPATTRVTTASTTTTTSTTTAEVLDMYRPLDGQLRLVGGRTENEASFFIPINCRRNFLNGLFFSFSLKRATFKFSTTANGARFATTNGTITRLESHVKKWVSRAAWGPLIALNSDTRCQSMCLYFHVSICILLFLLYVTLQNLDG